MRRMRNYSNFRLILEPAMQRRGAGRKIPYGMISVIGDTWMQSCLRSAGCTAVQKRFRWHAHYRDARCNDVLPASGMARRTEVLRSTFCHWKSVFCADE